MVPPVEVAFIAIDRFPAADAVFAVTVTVPAAVPETIPFADTVATAALLVDHVSAVPVTVFPAESNTVAFTGNVDPTSSEFEPADNTIVAGMLVTGREPFATPAKRRRLAVPDGTPVRTLTDAPPTRAEATAEGFAVGLAVR